MLSERRNTRAAKRFFCKTLTARHTTMPRVVNVDQHAAYPKSDASTQRTRSLLKGCQLRQNKYMNNIIEQDHRFIKRLINPGLGFISFETAARTLAGYEAMHMLRKGQLQGAPKWDIQRQVRFIELYRAKTASTMRKQESSCIISPLTLVG